MNETLETIRRRRSIRDFTSKQIQEEELQAILKAGIYAPYGDRQSRMFTVIQNREMINRINSEAKESAVSMGLPRMKQLGMQKDFNCFYGAPTAVIISGSRGFPGSVYDCSAAAQNMLLAAESINIGSCWIHFSMFAFNAGTGKALMRDLAIPEDFEPFISVSLGYKADNNTVIPQRDMTGVTYIR